jgi:AcrR family transcriptional regulator
MELSEETIVNAAIAILNRDGIDNLTMRAIATALGTKAASLYRHIKDKQDLYDLIAEKVTAEIKPSCSLNNAKKYLLEAAGLYRQGLRGIRDSVEIFTRSRAATPMRLAFMRNIMVCLLHLKVKESKCMVATHMLNNYILSSVTDECLFRALPTDTPNTYETILGTNFEWLSFDEQFTCGLEVLLAGFKVLT